jgi:NAD(P)-dependent dehydrogenase (short-subunit alcohol dehydrogenase family)
MTSAPDWLGLGGRLCVVTGAGGGMGRAIATSLADAGARLVLLERDAGLLATIAAEATRPGIAPPLALATDVSDPTRVAAAAARCAAERGPAEMLVNNAGLLRPGKLADLSLADWNGLLAINLNGYFLCAQAFGAQMRGPGGAMVHVASIAASHAQGFSGAYSASKAGVVMLSRQIATEWGPDGVRSNVVSPGMVETPMSAAFYLAPGVREARSAVVPRGRIGTAQDIADAVLFLASARADYITGEEIVVDGGFTRGIMSMVPRPGHQSK